MFLGSTLKIQEIVRMKDFFPLAKKVTTTNDTRCEKITACDGYKQRTILLKSAVRNASLHHGNWSLQNRCVLEA